MLALGKCVFATVLVAAVALTVANAAPLQARLSRNDEPAFCRSLDCPRFTVVNRTDTYEVRHYSASQWARTQVESANYTTATAIGFQRLFSYISGANVDVKHIPMTAPVTVQVYPGSGPYCKSTFTVSFMVPFAFQPNPPKPASKDVYIESEPAHTTYVTSFPGFAKEKDDIGHAEALAQALTKDNIAFNSTVYYTAGYDSPYQLFNRHNEVWFYAPGATQE
ncbi:hypothetical protein PTSG_05576 [Salpingoeca rosetta]|uniref:Heme-binding protein 2 n=1 Tax=Salpingoeca rosetta (strain ATCC 50818 / BSB-021) TaxID=946362 RepID=F2UBL5_SALR5|nr:uncharacterized protein PTSG_05576 [Salpingoeca rosetta]EGD73881.1 hypothetical protein PTSG_05576 [Salpingoeca rosetta]|eukprot:XP_004993444.1 hypothetical protein PTSG_05576 [Salpingoeca rosetta]